jgi:hypothetical protein
MSSRKTISRQPSKNNYPTSKYRQKNSETSRNTNGLDQGIRTTPEPEADTSCLRPGNPSRRPEFKQGESPEKACIDENFFKSYVADQLRPHTSGCGKVLELSDNFFRLGPILERVGPQRESISRTSAKFDEFLKNKMSVVRDRCKRDLALFDQKFPLISFNAARPACFVYFNLLRAMAVEANSLKKGDGMDFCHAVIACAFSSEL